MQHKIAFVMDVHITDNNPRNRTDDYFETCLNKLEQIFKNNNTVIFGGDLFDKPNINNKFLYNLILLFDKYSNVDKYSIIGNHDIFQMQESTIDKTSLGLLELCEKIKIIRGPIKIGSFNIDVLPLRHQEIPEFVEKHKSLSGEIMTNSILLGHHFFNQDESFNSSHVEQMVFENIFCAHDHAFYEPVKVGNSTVYRAGSLLRNAGFDYNLTRQLGYYQLIEDDTKSGYTINFVNIEHKLGSEVFTEDVVNQISKKKKRFFETIDNLISKYASNADNNSQSKFSLKEALKEIQTPSKCMEYISTAYNNNNIELR